MKKLKCITSDGVITYKDKMTLEEMQAFVGGYIELYRGVYCNEDGLRLQLPRNKVLPQFVGNIIQEVNE